MSKLTKILLIIGLFDLAFVITMIYIFLETGQEMTTLTTCVLGASGVEAVVSAAIKISNIKKEPLTHGDITGFDDAEIIGRDISEVRDINDIPDISDMKELVIDND